MLKEEKRLKAIALKESKKLNTLKKRIALKESKKLNRLKAKALKESEKSLAKALKESKKSSAKALKNTTPPGEEHPGATGTCNPDDIMILKNRHCRKACF